MAVERIDEFYLEQCAVIVDRLSNVRAEVSPISWKRAMDGGKKKKKPKQTTHTTEKQNKKHVPLCVCVCVCVCVLAGW